MTLTLTWRSALLNLLPRWLKGKRSEGSEDENSGHWGTRLNYALGVVQDAMGDALNAGLVASYPGLGDAWALALQGQARGIIRGLGETDESYAVRLRFWRQARKRKGNAFALMEQIQAYLAPYRVTLRVQYDDGTRYQLNPGGYLRAPAGYAGTGFVEFDSVTWNWDGTTDPTRFWILLCDTEETLWVSDGIWTDAGYWNDRNTSDGTISGSNLDPLANGDTTPTYGSTASYSTVQGILALVRYWAPPHSTPMSVIYCFDESTFDSIAPDGTWNHPGSRSQDYVYWEP
jgi:hypothetical protein